ncbi:MAG: N-acetylneuraminate synthase [Bacteroidales bacterium]|nr:N-acetylneuraminate synthase [Bacteroidales bacterium]
MREPVLIIAEAGVNHNGDPLLARQMVEVAAHCGADFVKFQTFKTEHLVTRDAPKATYQEANTGVIGSQYDMLKKLEISDKAHVELIRHCEKQGIGFLSTPFDSASAALLQRLGVGRFKVGSGDLTNIPLIRQLAGYGKPLIVSTGMATMREIARVVEVIDQVGLPRELVTLLHASTEYPAPYSGVNLRAMLTMKRRFGVRIGYSDHTQGIEIPVAAVALGAQVIEKHFTLDRNLEGPDHKASLEPEELAAMVRAIRNVEASLGSGRKNPTAGEKMNMQAARKSIVAACDIREGELLSEDNLTVKRPGTGIPSLEWDRIIGTFAVRDYRKDELI